MTTTVYEDYLVDLGVLVKEMAIEAKQQAQLERSDFATGYMAGFHRIVSLMQQQAEAFGISLDKIGFEEIDPNIDLV